jgi:hypothetical protein
MLERLTAERSTTAGHCSSGVKNNISSTTAGHCSSGVKNNISCHTNGRNAKILYLAGATHLRQQEGGSI